MMDYPFFLAQFTTFGYVVIYSLILHIRYRKGIVTDEMLALLKSGHVAIGAFEAVGTLIGMYPAANLPRRLDLLYLYCISGSNEEESMLSASEYMWAGVMILSSALHFRCHDTKG
ncbi:unnamed protein product [Linum tenue]|uniref:Uncharacterized protein n=1 Tax=Linum tenue TaxID=586396 RepID=A0AAV0HFQ9_9ROSI|nr:unnamed protein product [Linum tenue]